MAAASLVLGLNKNSDATPLATPTLTARPVTAATLAPPPTALPLADATLAAVAPAAAPTAADAAAAVAAASAAVADAAAAAASITPIAIAEAAAIGIAPGPVTATLARPMRPTAFAAPAIASCVAIHRAGASAPVTATPAGAAASSSSERPRAIASAVAAAVAPPTSLVKAVALGSLQVAYNKENSCSDSPVRARSGSSPVPSKVLTPSGNSPCRHRATAPLRHSAVSADWAAGLEAALAIQALHAGAGIMPGQ